MKKFYLVELTHKQTGKIFQKFGVTFSKDIMDRFDSSRFSDRVGYKDFIIRPLFSTWMSEETAEQTEQFFIRKYRNGFNIEEFLGIPRGTYNTNNLTGIFEMVDLGHDRNQVLRTLFSKYK